MPDKAYRESVPLMLFICAVSMVLAAFFVTIVLLISNNKEVLKNRENGLTNQFYNRSTNCFAATSPTKRTPQYVRDCYDKAEKSTGVKGERYGDASQ